MLVILKWLLFLVFGFLGFVFFSIVAIIAWTERGFGRRDRRGCRTHAELGGVAAYQSGPITAAPYRDAPDAGADDDGRDPREWQGAGLIAALTTALRQHAEFQDFEYDSARGGWETEIRAGKTGATLWIYLFEDGFCYLNLYQPWSYLPARRGAVAAVDAALRTLERLEVRWYRREDYGTPNPQATDSPFA